ncbi:MAG: hypothetical protein ACYTAF_10590 [Planctomycetota bacterium]|jgi:hypothetical protein
MNGLLAQAETTADQWWSRLLGIDRVNLSEGDWYLDWTNALPLWAIVLVVIPLICTVVWLIYRRERRDVGTGPKVFLTGVRAMLILLVLLLLMGPVITVEIQKSRKSYLIVMLDDSLSMLKRDPPIDPADKITLAEAVGEIEPGETELTTGQEEDLKQLTRADVVVRVLSNPRLQVLEKLEKKLNVAYFTFSKGARQVKDRGEFLETIPSGTETAIGDAVRQALSRLRGQHVVGVVVFSDGGNNSGTDPVAVARELKTRYVPIYTIPAGIKTTPRDIQLAELEAVDAVLANDPLKVEFKIRSFGYEGQPFDVPLYVRKIEPDRPLGTVPTEADGLEALITEAKEHSIRRDVTLEGGNKRQIETIHFTAEEPGDYLLILKIHPQEGENNRNNNYLVHRVRVADDKIRVLLVDEPPRYEYRFLKNALVTDEKILAHCLLTSADVGFPQEHSQNADDPKFREPIKEFPRTLQELLTYDVLILGDVDLGKIGGTRAAETIRKFVAEFGGGVIFISGELHNPRSFSGTDMMSLLPVVPEEMRSPFGAETLYSKEYKYKLTALGRVHKVIENCWKPLAGNTERIIEKWEDRAEPEGDGLPPLRWFCPVRSIKPGAQVLVEVSGVPGTPKTPPLFVVQHFGRGRVFWSATDDVYRWRYLVGDSPWYYPFWRQAMYWSRHGKLFGAVRYRVDVDKDRYMQNEEVKIYASAYDQNYEPLADEQLVVNVEPPEGERKPVRLTKDKTREGYYEGTFQPTVLGRYKIWAGEDDETTRAYDRFVVYVPNREEANPVLDVQRLMDIARASHQVKEERKEEEEAGEGEGAETPPETAKPPKQYYPLARVHEIAEDVSRTDLLITETKEDDLWDSPLVYLLFALLITAEWILRKVFRML